MVVIVAVAVVVGSGSGRSCSCVRQQWLERENGMTDGSCNGLGSTQNQLSYVGGVKVLLSVHPSLPSFRAPECARGTTRNNTECHSKAALELPRTGYHSYHQQGLASWTADKFVLRMVQATACR